MSRPPTPVAAAARRVTCPTCGATPGERCRTVRGRTTVEGRGTVRHYPPGKPAGTEHNARYDAATDAGHLPLGASVG